MKTAAVALLAGALLISTGHVSMAGDTQAERADARQYVLAIEGMT